MKQDYLTIEELSRAFDDNFQLTIHAINLAKHEIHAGKEVNTSILVEKLRKDPHATVISTEKPKPVIDVTEQIHE